MVILSYLAWAQKPLKKSNHPNVHIRNSWRPTNLNGYCHKVTIYRAAKPSRLFCVEYFVVTFTMVGHVRRPLLEKRGGNISYLCRQNFIALLCLDSNQHPSDLENWRKSKILEVWTCILLNSLSSSYHWAISVCDLFDVYSYIYPAQKQHL